MGEKKYDPDSGAPSAPDDTKQDQTPAPDTTNTPLDPRAIKYEAISVRAKPEPDTERSFSSRAGAVICVVVAKAGTDTEGDLLLTWHPADTFTNTRPISLRTKEIVKFFELTIRRGIGTREVTITANESDSEKRPYTKLHLQVGDKPEDDVIKVVDVKDVPAKIHDTL